MATHLFRPSPRVIIAALLAALIASPARAQCPGDCDGDGDVGIHELILGIAVALGSGDREACVVVDANEDGRVEIAELVRGVGAALAGCPMCGTEAFPCPDLPFDFATAEEAAFALQVTLDGQPAAGVRVTVTDHLPWPEGDQAIEDLIGGRLYLQGVTDAEGRLDGLVKIPTAVDAVDIVANLADASGPYTVEALRAFWGPFAPSARLRVARAALGDVRLALRGDATSPLRAAQAVVAPAQTVPSALLKTIGQILPEQSSAGASFVSDVYSPNLIVTEPATVSVTFVFEGAGYQNTMGYFTYQEEPDGRITILSSDLLFPNASFPSAGAMRSGDTVVLGDAAGRERLFEPGERIGFFLIANGWVADSRVRTWTYSLPGVPSTDPTANRLSGYGLYTTLNQLNPENAVGREDLSRHVAMLHMNGVAGFLDGKDFFLTGFEDQNRAVGTDNDFNDLVVVVTATPFRAIAESDVLPYEPGDPDGDGVSGTSDHYPTDPERAFVTRYPTSGSTVVALEDQYPRPGDIDYDDAVVAYEFELVADRTGAIKDLLATFHLLARGASYDHRLGLHLPGLPAGADGLVRLERFLSGDEPAYESEPDRTVAAIVAADRRIDDLFPSTVRALPPLAGRIYTNTKSVTPDRPPASARLAITFTDAIPAATLGVVPYDLYFDVVRGAERWDVHFPGRPPFAERPSHLPAEVGAAAFLDPNGYPFRLELPNEWRFPLESVPVDLAYPSFTLWRSSRGTSGRSWYASPTNKPGRLSSPLGNYLPSRDWTLRLPPP